MLDIADEVLRSTSIRTMAPGGPPGRSHPPPAPLRLPSRDDCDLCESDGHVYRTRMAETVRLLARLRQLGPGRSWRAAPPLVADYRFSVRPRAYPERHRDPARVRSALNDAVRLTPIQETALQALLQTPEGDLELADFPGRCSGQHPPRPRPASQLSRHHRRSGDGLWQDAGLLPPGFPPHRTSHWGDARRRLGEGHRGLPPQRAPQGPALRCRRECPVARQHPRTSPSDIHRGLLR